MEGLTNIAINSNNELIFVIGDGMNDIDNVRIEGVYEYGFAHEYQEPDEYIPFK